MQKWTLHGPGGQDLHAELRQVALRAEWLYQRCSHAFVPRLHGALQQHFWLHGRPVLSESGELRALAGVWEHYGSGSYE